MNREELVLKLSKDLLELIDKMKDEIECLNLLTKLDIEKHKLKEFKGDKDE